MTKQQWKPEAPHTTPSRPGHSAAKAASIVQQKGLTPSPERNPKHLLSEIPLPPPAPPKSFSPSSSSASPKESDEISPTSQTDSAPLAKLSLEQIDELILSTHEIRVEAIPLRRKDDRHNAILAKTATAAIDHAKKTFKYWAEANKDQGDAVYKVLGEGNKNPIAAGKKALNNVPMSEISRAIRVVRIMKGGDTDRFLSTPGQ